MYNISTIKCIIENIYIYYSLKFKLSLLDFGFSSENQEFLPAMIGRVKNALGLTPFRQGDNNADFIVRKNRSESQEPTSPFLRA